MKHAYNNFTIIILFMSHYFSFISLFIRGSVPHLNIKHVLCTISKLSLIFWQNMSTLIQTAYEIQKWHWNFTRSINSWIINHSNTFCAGVKNSIIRLASLTNFMSFSGNLLLDPVFFFQSIVDNFEMAHEKCSILFWDAFHPNQKQISTDENQ